MDTQQYTKCSTVQILKSKLYMDTHARTHTRTPWLQSKCTRAQILNKYTMVQIFTVQILKSVGSLIEKMYSGTNPKKYTMVQIFIVKILKSTLYGLQL
jgi:hypothetical protein